MNNIMKRLRNKAGETLVESMAAILIFTFASIIMLSMVSSAADINTAAKEADHDFYSQMVTIEQASGSGTTIKVTFTVDSSASKLYSLSSTGDAAMYGDPENGLYAYYANAAAPAGEGGGA